MALSRGYLAQLAGDRETGLPPASAHLIVETISIRLKGVSRSSFPHYTSMVMIARLRSI
jgi:hypothetical protein